MKIIDILKRGKKFDLKDIKSEDLMREKVSLGHELKKINNEVSKAENKKVELIRKGSQLSSDSEKLMMVQQVKVEQVNVKGLVNMHKILSKKHELISGLEVLKRNEETVRKFAGSIVDKLDIDVLNRNMSEIVVEGQINYEKLVQLTDSLSIPFGEEMDEKIDDESSEILDLMNIVAETSDVDIKSELDKRLKTISEDEEF